MPSDHRADADWPVVASEPRPWASRYPPEMVPRSVRERHEGPYRAAVLPEIADVTPVLSSATLALADAASIEIARFDAELGTDLAPFGSILLRTESTSSSRIENLTAGAKAIAIAELGRDPVGGRRNAIEIVANVKAMQAAVALANTLDEHSVLAMHDALMGDLHPDLTGRWRPDQVWIGGSDFGPHHARFVPPHADRVPAAMADLLRFAQRGDIPVLAHAALAHAQFETIHPFPDGNGRTGRALVHAMLRGKGLTRHVTVPVSAGLLTDTGVYFDALTAYRDGDPERIVVLMAQASFGALANGRQLVADLREIRLRWHELLKVRRDSMAWALVDLLLRLPVIDSAAVRQELGATTANTGRAIRALVAAGAVTEFTDRRRSRLWQAGEVLAALDAFAERAVRRTP